MRRLPATRIALAAALLVASAAYAGNPLKVSAVFLAAQRCHVNGTVDYGCYQQHLASFERFVLQDDATWMQKSIVADGLTKTYDALKMDPNALRDSVRVKASIYKKAAQSLDKAEIGQIGDCQDETNPDSCLKVRYCFREAYIKIKNILIADHPELFQPEIKAFDRLTGGNC